MPSKILTFESHPNIEELTRSRIMIEMPAIAPKTLPNVSLPATFTNPTLTGSASNITQQRSVNYQIMPATGQQNPVFSQSTMKQPTMSLSIPIKRSVFQQPTTTSMNLPAFQQPTTTTTSSMNLSAFQQPTTLPALQQLPIPANKKILAPVKKKVSRN